MSTMDAAYLPLFFCVFVLSGSLAAIPGGLMPCKQSSVDYSRCLGREIERAMLFFKNGDRRLGVSSIDPLMFDRMVVDQNSGPVAIDLEFRNLEIYGMSNNRIYDAKNDWKIVSFSAKIPTLMILGDYTISGKVLVLPISGSGKCNITMTDVEAEIGLMLREVDRNGKKYAQAEKIQNYFAPQKAYFNFENLFNGDKDMGDNMNAFLNENYEQIIQELNPAIVAGLAQGFGQIVNQILAKIPLDEIKVD